MVFYFLRNPRCTHKLSVNYVWNRSKGIVLTSTTFHSVSIYDWIEYNYVGSCFFQWMSRGPLRLCLLLTRLIARNWYIRKRVFYIFKYIFKSTPLLDYPSCITRWRNSYCIITFTVQFVYFDMTEEFSQIASNLRTIDASTI